MHSMKGKVPRENCSSGTTRSRWWKRGGDGARAPAAPGDNETARTGADYGVLDDAARKLVRLELRSLSGRTHRLRVHCARGLDAPILGDLTCAGPDTAQRWSRDCRTHYNCMRPSHLPHPPGGRLTV